MNDISQPDFNDRTSIKVVGVGGAGGNALNRMIDEGLQNVEFIAINTDAQDLLRSNADVKISLSDSSSRGLGAGADPEKGAKAALDHQSDIEEALKGADMVFVTCGEGGGTGTGASPLVARTSHQLGALTIAVVTRPFKFEGPRRSASADLGIENLRKEVDALIIIPNDRLLDLSDRAMTVIDAFKTADGALLAGVQGITDLMTMNSYIHVDFRDVTQILKDQGTALFGIGSARGEDRATQAAEFAISSPLLEASIEGAHGALVNVAGPTDLGMQEAQAAVELVQHSIHPEAQIIWGLALDDAYGDEVRVTVIAAGFDSVKPSRTALATPLIKNRAESFQRVSQSAPSETLKPEPEVPAINPVHLGQVRTDRIDDTAERSAISRDDVDALQRVEKESARTESQHSESKQSEPQHSDDDFDELDIPPFLR